MLVLGGGFAGQCQVRHLLRERPHLSVGLVEPRSLDELGAISKIGESTVEVAATFLGRELGLYDYLVENHHPKVGLAFHWPRDPAKTDGLEDYLSLWPVRNPTLASWQLHRGRFERDLMQMNVDAGATWVRGTVAELELNDGAAPNRVRVQTDGGEVWITCDHLVDAAGRAFLTGRATDNIVRDPAAMHGLNNGATWVRVRGVDRERFVAGFDPGRTITSHYYATNHFLGHGHWLWMIPITSGDELELSVGVMFHHEAVRAKDLGTPEKFEAILRANHAVLAVLADLLEGTERVDFACWARPSHTCKQVFSPDRWYALGDAAWFGDAFYSQGTSAIAFGVASVTDLVGRGDADFEARRQAYDAFNLWWADSVLHLYRDHSWQLGHAGAMSWRIYLEYMWWFGAWIPTFLGRWFLDPEFIGQIRRGDIRWFLQAASEDLGELARSGEAGLRLLDPYRSDQLALGYGPTQERGPWLENVEAAPQRLNVYDSMGATFLMTAVWWLRLQAALGTGRLLRWRTWSLALRLVRQGLWVRLGGLRHRWRRRGVPANPAAQEQAGFSVGAYRPPTQTRPWIEPRGPAPAGPGEPPCA